MRQRCLTRRAHFRSTAAILSLGLVLTACGGGDDDTSAEGGGTESCDYPEEQITFISPYAPGGSTEPLIRKYTDLLEQELEGAELVVEVREGGNTTVGGSAILAAEPDGYTIGMVTGSTIFVQPLVNEELGWDGLDDFTAIGLMGAGATVLAVKGDSEWETLDELFEYAEENPGEVQVGMAGLRGTQHLSTYLVAESAGVELEAVPFSGGGGEALIAMLGGRVEVLAGQAPTLKGYVDSGEVRALAVMSDAPDPILPDVPTTVDLGYAEGLSADLLIVGPKGIPDCELDKLGAANQRVLESPEYVEFLEQNGYRVEETASDPEQLVADLEEDSDKYAAVRPLLEEE